MLQVENLSYIYPNGHHALDGVSFTIAAGEAVAIMGSNGAGKTTLVKHFNGLLKPTSGCVLVHGIDTRQAKVSDLAPLVGLVFQNPYQQLFAQTVVEEIALGLRNHHRGEPIEAAVSRIIRQFHLEGLENRHPLSLSEGQKKRLALAAVLAMDPAVLVLDEPTLGQDGREKAALRDTLDSIKKRGRTVIVVTHDIDFACTCCQRIIILHKGRVLADAPAQVINHQPDVLRRAGLMPPQLVELAEILAPWGFDHPMDSCEELATAIIEAVKKPERRVEPRKGQDIFPLEHKEITVNRYPEHIAELSAPKSLCSLGPIGRMDPRGKVTSVFLLFIALSLAVTSLPIGLIAIALGTVVLVERIARPLLRIIGMLLPVVLLVGIMDVLYFGPEHGSLVSFRFLLTVSLFAIFFLTTPLDDLSAALMTWRLPYPLVFALVMGARFAPTVTREAQEIMDAYQARGIDGTWGPLAWLRRYARILVPLVAASIRRSLRLGEAMEMRGFGKTNRPTLLRELIWCWPDTIMVILAGTLLILSITIR